MGPDFQKIQKSSKPAMFEREKSLNMGRGFRPRATQPVKKSFEPHNPSKNNLSIPFPRVMLAQTQCQSDLVTIY